MNQPKSVLVFGSGSIARRHIDNIRHLLPGAEIACVSASGRMLSKQEIDADVICENFSDAVERRPDFAVIASPAPFHLEHACLLLNSGTPVFIEKPISNEIEKVKSVLPMLLQNHDKIEVGYNLRFLSSSRKMKKLLDQATVGKILSVRIEVGHYLPDWRPQSDYRTQVSAKKSLGGGALLELSHELDYANWLFGPFDRVFCIISNSGQLELDVEDRADILLSRQDFVAAVHLDFLQRSPERSCKIVGDSGTLNWDLLANTITLNRKSEKKILFSEPQVNRNQMYIEQMRGFIDVVSGRAEPRVTLGDGLKVLDMIEAMRHSARHLSQVNLPFTPVAS